jgi:hypothetical protein
MDKVRFSAGPGIFSEASGPAVMPVQFPGHRIPEVISLGVRQPNRETGVKNVRSCTSAVQYTLMLA